MKKLVALFAFSLLGFASSVTPQEQIAVQGASPENPAISADSLVSSAYVQPAVFTELQDFDSIWQLMERGGGIRWGIFLVFALALSFIVKKLLTLSIDLWNARRLERLELQAVTIDDVQQFVLQARSSLLATVLAKQLDIFENTRKPDLLHEELNSFIAMQREHFTRFSNRMSFLSDTAGALGLLGTVWGMFLTFFGGTLDSQRILHGMGIALITTLLGLVVSIVINFANTEVSNFFNRRLERVFEVADALRMRLFVGTRFGSIAAGVPATAEEAASLFSSPREILLQPISELKQVCTVGKHLPRPITVQVVNAAGIGIPGVDVVFEVIGNGGHFVDKQTKYSATTNKKGQAEASFLLTGEVGKRHVVAHIEGNVDNRLEFQITGIPGPPAKLVSVSGNHQSATTGQLLAKPFVVLLTDAFGNPVKDSVVVFTITKGNGRFAHHNPEDDDEENGFKGMFKKKFLAQKVNFETRTDVRGYAEAQLILGPIPGVNEVTAVARGLSKSPVVFDAMAQAEEEVTT